MNTRLIHIIGFCLSLCAALLLSILAAAQEPRATSAGSTFVSRGEDLSALVRWRVAGKDGHLLCVITQRNPESGDSSLPIRVLRVYREEGTKLIEIFKHETPDTILNMYPLADYDGRLFLTWVGGSAYHFQVLAFADGQVKQVLSDGSKLPPEFVHDDRGRESVFITEPIMENGKWTTANGTTTVFKWDGLRYEKIGTVPWAKRLQCLSKVSCASLK